MRCFRAKAKTRPDKKPKVSGRSELMKEEERTNKPVSRETCGTDFSSPQDFERYATEDHSEIFQPK
jgi:hypothetical protein